jgi:sialate O-acetylesterase
MVPSGTKVSNRTLINCIVSLAFIHVGEANAGYNTDKYACSFSKMIQYWRQTWNERTNGITDIQFPFGFVQVSFTQNHEEFHSYVKR